MIDILLIIVSTAILIPLAIFFGKKTYFYALLKGWKKPNEWVYVPSSLLVLPALQTMNAFEKLSGSDIFLSTNKDTSVAEWIFYVFCVAFLVKFFRFPAEIQLKKFLKQQAKAQSHS